MRNMIRLALEKLTKSLLSGPIHYSDNLEHLSGNQKKIFSNLVNPSAHRCLEFVTLIRGNAVLQLGSTPINAQPDDVWAILPQTLHCEGIMDKKKSYVLLWAIVISRGIHFFLSEYNALTNNRLSSNRLFVEFSCAHDLWEISRNTMLSKDLLLQAKFISLLLAGCAQGLVDTTKIDKKSSVWVANHQKLVQQIKDYIEQNYHDRLLRISELSTFAGYTPNHLGVLFKKYTNQSIHQYLIDVKLNAAKEFLRTGKHQIKDIAFLVGFDDPLYFSRIFKKRFRLSPVEYLHSFKTSQSKNINAPQLK